jgi:hypothetical protein
MMDLPSQSRRHVGAPAPSPDERLVGVKNGQGSVRFHIGTKDFRSAAKKHSTTEISATRTAKK